MLKTPFKPATQNKFAAARVTVPNTPAYTIMSLQEPALNTQVLTITLITVVSLLVGLLLGNNIKSDEKTKRRVQNYIVNSTSHLANALAKIQEGSLIVDDEDKISIINALLKSLDEENHPDADILHYIVTEVINNRHPSQIYEVWLTIAYRRLAIDPSGLLPEPWFIEPVAPPSEELDLSDISEANEDDHNDINHHDEEEDDEGFKTEAGPLVSPNLSKDILSFETDELNTARIYEPPAEVGLPQHLDMNAVD